MVVTAAVVISLTVIAVVAIASRSGGGGGGIGGFNACITQTRFLVLVRHQGGHSPVETIKERGRDAVVGEVVNDRGRDAVVGGVATDQPPTLGGAAAADGRYVMSTATPLGRDASAIEGCWDRSFPIAP